MCQSLSPALRKRCGRLRELVEKGGSERAMAKAINWVLALTGDFLFAGCGHQTPEVKKLADAAFFRNGPYQPLPPHKFKSDGCSCWPDGNWVECCVEHDLVYWMGGTSEERKAADRELTRCVSEHGHPAIARLMYFGVRAGGVWWLSTPFRWGFGWDYPQTGPPGKPYSSK
jgi:hypothetical protein